MNVYGHYDVVLGNKQYAFLKQIKTGWTFHQVNENSSIVTVLGLPTCSGKGTYRDNEQYSK